MNAHFVCCFENKAEKAFFFSPTHTFFIFSFRFNFLHNVLYLVISFIMSSKMLKKPSEMFLLFKGVYPLKIQFEKIVGNVCGVEEGGEFRRSKFEMT